MLLKWGHSNGVNEMTQQIENALNAKGVITDVSVDGKYVEFNLNGVGYFGRVSRGKFISGSERRASY